MDTRFVYMQDHLVHARRLCVCLSQHINGHFNWTMCRHIVSIRFDNVQVILYMFNIVWYFTCHAYSMCRIEKGLNNRTWKIVYTYRCHRTELSTIPYCVQAQQQFVTRGWENKHSHTHPHPHTHIIPISCLFSKMLVIAGHWMPRCWL